MSEREREAFEKWYKDAWPFANSYTQHKLLLEGWQARASQSQASGEVKWMPMKLAQSLYDFSKEYVSLKIIGYKPNGVGRMLEPKDVDQIWIGLSDLEPLTVSPTQQQMLKDLVMARDALLKINHLDSHVHDVEHASNIAGKALQRLSGYVE